MKFSKVWWFVPLFVERWAIVSVIDQYEIQNFSIFYAHYRSSLGVGMHILLKNHVKDLFFVIIIDQSHIYLQVLQEASVALLLVFYTTGQITLK